MFILKLIRRTAYANAILLLCLSTGVSAETSVGYVANTVSENSIIIDGVLDDWSEVESFGYDGETLQGSGIEADIVEGWLAHDNNHFYVAYQNSTDIAWERERGTRWAWQVFFDVDDTNESGFNVDDTLGAEYMLQGSGVYKYDGSGSDWSWIYVSKATNAVIGSIAEFKIPRSALGLPDKLKVRFKGKNAAFPESYAQSGVDIYPRPVDTYPSPVEPVSLHNKLLNRQYSIWRASDRGLEMTLPEAAIEGAMQLVTAEAHPLFDNQLITYLSDNGEYYVAQVASVDGTVINLTKPLEAPIALGKNLWNFYLDGAHPTSFGAKAIADFAIREIGIEVLSSGKHVLLGDSWFDWFDAEALEYHLAKRLTDRLGDGAVIINKATGGQTSKDVLSRFDSDVLTENPDFVWVMVGINDAFSEVPVSEYLANMQAIIAKIKSLGAKPVIFDSQVAQLFSGHELGVDYKTQLTHGYSEALGDANSVIRYQLTESVVSVPIDAISNPKTIDIDGSLSDWDDLQAFAEDADDIDEVGAKANLLEVSMAHDDTAFYIAYKNGDADSSDDADVSNNSGEIITSDWWNWRIYLDTDNAERTGFQVGNGIGADFVIQGGNLAKYNGNGFNWDWKFVERSENKVNGVIAELKLSRSAINNPDFLSLVLKASNGFFNSNYTESGVDSYPDIDQGHLDYLFGQQTSENIAPDADEDSLPSEINLPEFEIDVLANDTDANGDTLTVQSVTPARSGVVRLVDGKVLYTPPSTTASDTFRYTISDGRGGTDSTSVTIGVRDPDDPNLNNPVVRNESITMAAGDTVVIKVLENDTDADGDTLSLDEVDNGSQGTTKKVPDENGDLNWIEYTSVPTATGTDEFYYGVPDGRGGNGSGKVEITFE